MTLLKILIVSSIILTLTSILTNKSLATTHPNVYQWYNDLKVSEVAGLSDVVMLKKGISHSLALDTEGNLWAWGSNAYGQLGNGSKNDSSIPQRVLGPDGIGFFTGIKAISAGDRFSIALMQNGSVFAWGENASGVRGTEISGSNAIDLLYPTQIKSSSSTFLTNIIAVDGGDDYAVALSSNNQVYSWGWNGNGELGIGCFPSVGQCSRDFIPNSTVPGLDEVINIAAGGSHIIVVKSNGEVWGWGRAWEGQLGRATNTSRIAVPVQIPDLENVKKVSAENYGSGALTHDGKVYIWGKGLHDPVKITDLPKIIDLSIGHNYDLALAEDGSVWRWNKDNLKPQKIPALESIFAISAGYGNPSIAASEPGESTPTPFLNLPVNNVALGKSFDEIALDPESWFDHQYPLQDVPCCITQVLKYTGKTDNDYYRSHAGYDYASKHGLGLGESVLAAAEGTATYFPLNGALGNPIKIDHKNGYQTWYAHLNSTVLDVEGSQTVEVVAGQEIGKIGKTGTVNGPHLHFSVFKDENENGTFTDDYPFGLVDPLGWLGDYTDPWEDYESGGRNGAKSYSLFVDHTPPLSQFIPEIGGNVNYKNLTVTVPSHVIETALKIKVTTGPFEKKSSDIKSVAPSFFLEAFDNLNQKITDFLEPITLTYGYGNSDLSNFNEDTLKFYYFDEEDSAWVELPTTIDKNIKTVVTITPHFSQFAVMGELLDILAPTTTVNASGEKSQDNWYHTDVSVTLIGEDNEGGLGIFDTIYTIDGESWNIYTEPLFFEDEGAYSISFMSYDLAGNEEDIKTFTFTIDKTPPVVEIRTDKSLIWPPNGQLVPVTIDGSANDENLLRDYVIVKDEYDEIGPLLTNFGDTVHLPASRNGDDLDGRKYTFTAKAEDKAGNVSTATKEVIVVHDQRIN